MRAEPRQDSGSAPGSESPTPLWDRVYTVLVNEAGAMETEGDRMQFQHFWTRSDDPDEYRFIGTLGFGGKLWRARDKWYVNCYREDETPERLSTIARTNAALDALTRSEARQGVATPKDSGGGR